MKKVKMMKQYFIRKCMSEGLSKWACMCVCVCIHAHMQQAHMCGNKFFLYSGLLTTVQMTINVK